MLMDVAESRLSNGMRVITAAQPGVESVTLGIWVGTGSRFETNAEAGACHFIEHLLFKGTRKRSARDISIAIEGRGGYLNAFTQEENTCYYARVAREHLRQALDVLSDMYLNPRFDPSDIEKERGVIVEEIMMYRDQPQHMVQEALVDALWKGHPLGRPVTGTPESLGKMTRDSIGAFHRRHYRPAHTLLAFAGKVQHAECAAMSERLMGALAQGPHARGRRDGSAARQAPMALQQKTVEQTNLALGIRLFGRHDERRHALRLLNAILGENMSSRLFQIVRERYGLAYSVSSSFHLFEETGALVISAGLDRKRSFKAIELILHELRRLKERPIGHAELKRAKDYAIGQIKLGLESTTHQMMWLGDSIMSHDRFIPPEEVMDIISRVSADDIRKLANDTIASAGASLALISPDVAKGDEDRLRDLLRRL